jgi:hypothetical protein
MTALGPLENCDWAYIKAHLHIRAISFRPAITATQKRIQAHGDTRGPKKNPARFLWRGFLSGLGLGFGQPSNHAG